MHSIVVYERRFNRYFTPSLALMGNSSSQAAGRPSCRPRLDEPRRRRLRRDQQQRK
jgi:hypothetical protein